MRNLKLTVEYDGTDYCGWQIQNRCPLPLPDRQAGVARCPSIQETIEKILRKILQEKIHLIASGRTDAGVHAQAQVANFKTKSNVSLVKLQRALNGLLPGGISISKIEEAPFDFHSRFAAKSKVYRYSILNRKYPCALLRNRVYFYPYPLDIKLMRQEARCLSGRHDFKAFCASASNTKNTIRTIKKITIRKTNHGLNNGPLIIIDIEADGFLYNMARNIVGTLMEVGRGRFPQGSLKKILNSKDRKLAGPTVPACGLCLLKVEY
jgi:tRNA pseudouridine38-40 synthase